VTCIISNYVHICYIHAHYDTLHLHTFFILNSEDELLRAQLEYEIAKLNLSDDEGNSAIHNVHTRFVSTKRRRYESAKVTVQRLREEIDALIENEEQAIMPIVTSISTVASKMMTRMMMARIVRVRVENPIVIKNQRVKNQ
jgi:hypothetical protein